MSIAPWRSNVGDDALAAAIAGTLARSGTAKLVSIDRAPSEYATSHGLENVTVTLDEGSSLGLVLKDLSPDALDDRGRRLKPAFLIDPRREIAVYRQILAPRRLGARLYGSSDRDVGVGRWLLLEKAPGVELYQVADLEAWRAAAAWLARFHQSQFEADAVRAGVPLIEYQLPLYRVWIERAQTFFRDQPPNSRAGAGALAWLAARFGLVVDRLRAWPKTMIHGEFFASNVLVHDQGGEWAVCPIDWEMAGAGPGILDLGALTSGASSDDDRRTIISAYVDALREPATSLAETIEAVDYAHIYLAVQWLGWYGRRKPPAEHGRDWLGDAVEIAQRLGL